MAKGRTKADLEREVARLKVQVQYLRRYGFLGNATKICGEAFRAARIIAPWAFGFFSIRALAGKATLASLSAKVESESLSEALVEIAREYLGETSLFALLAIAAIGGIVYGKRQARLRQDDVQSLQEFKVKYERLFDPKRSSSRITKRGDTRPEDE